MASSPTCSSSASTGESTSSVTLRSPPAEQVSESLKELKDYTQPPTSYQQLTNDGFDESQSTLNTNKKINSISFLLQSQIKKIISAYANKKNRNLNLSLSQPVSPSSKRKIEFDVVQIKEEEK